MMNPGTISKPDKPLSKRSISENGSGIVGLTVCPKEHTLSLKNTTSRLPW